MSIQQARRKGFCTFCMGEFDPSRVGRHVKQCRDRKDDAACILLNGVKHPLAFLLVAEIEDQVDRWVCLEAHGEASFALLDIGLRQLWFPEEEVPGVFLPAGRMVRRIGTDLPFEETQRLDAIVQAGDHFTWVPPDGSAEGEVRIEVLKLLPTAIMHCMIDVAVFQLGGIVDRWRPLGEPPR